MSDRTRAKKSTFNSQPIQAEARITAGVYEKGRLRRRRATRSWAVHHRPGTSIRFLIIRIQPDEPSSAVTFIVERNFQLCQALTSSVIVSVRMAGRQESLL